MIVKSDLYHIANKTYAGVRGFMNEQTRQARPEAWAENITRADRNADVMTIDLVEVFQVIWHWLWLIVLVALACGTAAYAFSKFVLPEEFESTTKMVLCHYSDFSQERGDIFIHVIFPPLD